MPVAATCQLDRVSRMGLEVETVVLEDYLAFLTADPHFYDIAWAGDRVAGGTDLARQAGNLTGTRRGPARRVNSDRRVLRRLVRKVGGGRRPARSRRRSGGPHAETDAARA